LYNPPFGGDYPSPKRGGAPPPKGGYEIFRKTVFHSR